jgi:hypothetical protein
MHTVVVRNMITERDIQSLQHWKQKVNDHPQEEHVDGAEVFFSPALTIFRGHKARPGEHQPEASEKFIVEVGNEMKCLFNEV